MHRTSLQHSQPCYFASNFCAEDWKDTKWCEGERGCREGVLWVNVLWVFKKNWTFGERFVCVCWVADWGFIGCLLGNLWWYFQAILYSAFESLCNCLWLRSFVSDFLVGFEKNWAFGEKFICFLFSLKSDKTPKYLLLQRQPKQNKLLKSKRPALSSILFVTS